MTKESSPNNEQPKTKRFKRILSTPNASFHGDKELRAKMTPQQLDAARDEMFARLNKELGLDNPEAEAELDAIRKTIREGGVVKPIQTDSENTTDK
jgi:predicted P-loop ATPase